MTGRLVVVPITWRDAAAYVQLHHRHSARPHGYRAAIAAAVGDEVVGVAILGRPINKTLDDGWTLEVLRCCTEGHPNANSFLYGASWRLARALGYRRAVTYTLKSESGSSLKAAGWQIVGEVRPQTWDRRLRPRIDKHELQERFRWEVSA